MLSLGSALGVAAFGQNLFGAFTPAGRLLGSEPAGFAIDFANDSALIRWPSNPASQYSGNIAGLISAGMLSFSRASTATYFDAAGVMQTASNDVLRRTYDPSTLAVLGYLPEPQRTNLCLYSADFTQSAWTKSNLSAAMTATGPDGVANSASTLTATAANGTALQSITQSSATRVTSAWIKRRTGTGTISITHDNGTTWTDITVTSAWTRVSNPSTTAANPTVGIRISTSGDAVDVAMQHETGSYPSSYIPTTSSTVTRAADVMTAGLSSLPFSTTAGTFVAVAQPTPDRGANQASLASLRKDSNDRWIFRSGASGNDGINVLGVHGGANTLLVAATNAAVAQRFKTAAAWQTDDLEVVVAGASGGTDTSGALPSGLTDFNIGHSGGGFDWGAPIEGLIYIPRRLTQAEMIARTS